MVGLVSNGRSSGENDHPEPRQAAQKKKKKQKKDWKSINYYPGKRARVDNGTGGKSGRERVREREDKEAPREAQRVFVKDKRDSSNEHWE